ncbi:hypothetical protein BDR22DRAFT_120615 [Usnea florida]
MSGQPSGNPSGPRAMANGVGAGGMTASQQRADSQMGSSTSNGQSGSMSQSNLNSIKRAHSTFRDTSKFRAPANVPASTDTRSRGQVCPLALIEKQAGPLASLGSNPPSSRGRSKAKEKPYHGHSYSVLEHCNRPRNRIDAQNQVFLLARAFYRSPKPLEAARFILAWPCIAI